jgi:hypothetical protein
MVIESLHAVIATQATEELDGSKQRAQALRVQEAYRVSKNIAMKRCIDYAQSPQCPTEGQTITEHFSRA